MATIFMKGKNYYINYRHKGARRRLKIGPNKKQAEQVLKKIEYEIVQDKFDLPSDGKSKTFQEVVEYWLENYSKVRNAPSTYEKNKERVRKHLIPFFGNRRLNEISPKIVDEFIRGKDQEVSSATVNRLIALIRKIFNDAIKWGYTKTNPVTKGTRLHEVQREFSYLTQEQTQLLLENCSTGWRPIISCLAYTGMRVTEVCELRWDQVDFEQGIIKVERGGTRGTKSKRTRYIPIHSKLRKVLEEIKEDGSQDGLVFPNPQGRQRSRDLRSGLKSALRKAGLPHIRIHDLRHTFASNFIMQGGHLMSLQKILGHSTITMTLRYAHLAPDFLKGEIEILDFG